MASFIYNSFWDDLARGNIDLDTDSFKAMLVSSSYSADKDAHLKRSSVTNEVSGTGYSAGGTAVTITLAKDTANDRLTATFSSPSWASSSVTARGAVYYKNTGSASTDPLCFFVDFGSNVVSSGATFSISASVITLQN
ncbi:MAG: hypothetical protein WCQ20_14890 [Synechococcaceae cyanobacterium ELA739]|jgi:hypothetical protein